MLQEIYSEFKSTPKVRLDYIPHPQLQHTKLLRSIRSRAVVQYSFQFAKIKKRKKTIYQGIGLIPLLLMDAAALNWAGQLFHSVLGEDF